MIYYLIKVVFEMIKLSVIIPAYNEEKTIDKFTEIVEKDKLFWCFYILKYGYDEYIHSMSFDLDNNKEIRITHDDDGIPCIDIVIDRDIIFTVRPKEEVDLHNFVRDLGNH